MQRRELITSAAALSGLGLVGCATISEVSAPAIATKAKPKVVVVGAGFGGATAAKYTAMWGEGAIEVTLIERNRDFVSCPMSNLVIGGSRKIESMTSNASGLSKYGVNVVYGNVEGIDPGRRLVRLTGGQEIAYDRLVLSPGVDFMYNELPGLNSAESQSKVLHAWKAGPETVALRKQLEAMRDGGVFAISIPKAPYRCPPGPYERACQVAWYFKQHKPKSKVLILDANEDVVSKKGLFMAQWNGQYKGIVEYKNNSQLLDVDVATNTAKLEFENIKADVLNVLPPMRAGDIARKFGMNNANARWCGVDFLTYESTVISNIHIIGDAIQIAPLMPKSGHMANQHAKVCAAALVNLLQGKPVNPAPMVANTCYSFVDDQKVVHVASVHAYSNEKKTMEVVAGSGGLSASANELEGVYANHWAETIWADMLK